LLQKIAEARRTVKPFDVLRRNQGTPGGGRPAPNRDERA
jgi:hypothetical protein